jgi:hypothetical protein
MVCANNPVGIVNGQDIDMVDAVASSLEFADNNENGSSFLSLFHGAYDQNNSTSLADRPPGRIQFHPGDSPWHKPWCC